MHITELKKAVDALRTQVEELREQRANKVLLDTLDDFNNRIAAIENRLTEAGI